MCIKKTYRYLLCGHSHIFPIHHCISYYPRLTSHKIRLEKYSKSSWLSKLFCTAPPTEFSCKVRWADVESVRGRCEVCRKMDRVWDEASASVLCGAAACCDCRRYGLAAAGAEETASLGEPRDVTAVAEVFGFQKSLRSRELPSIGGATKVEEVADCNEGINVVGGRPRPFAMVLKMDPSLLNTEAKLPHTDF